MPTEADLPTDLQALERDYELIRELGRGGMAAVYLARRRDSGRLVAIKAIRARYLDDPEVLQRFAREAHTVADLDHPNIVRTEAIEQIEDRAVAIITEYIPGGTVRDRLREYGPFSAEAAESVLRDVASALVYAHKRGIVHRDVKPENVFLDERTGRALLADFGIARRIEGDVPITMLGAAVGTPQYMSPEQIDGGRVDVRSDIYSVGVLGWELLTGRRPWEGDNLYTIIYKQKHETLPRITTLRPRVPANLLAVIERALEKDPSRRWQTAEELVEHLTYEPPPVLAQTFRGQSPDADDEGTVRFRREPDVTAAPAAPPAVLRGARSEVDAVPTPATGRHSASRRTSGGLPLFRRPIVRVALLAALVVIAAGSLAVVFDLPTFGRSSGSGDLTASTGSVALDSTPVATASPTARSDSIPNDARPTTPKSSSPPPRTDSAPVRSRVSAMDTAARSAAPTRVSANDVASGAEPSPRCRVATTADQRACLLAHIANNDARLQTVYDSLIVELRRLAGVSRRAPDPPDVTRLRVEQRAWITSRDRDCMRGQPRSSTSLWARERSICFAEKSDARATELRTRLETARGQGR